MEEASMSPRVVPVVRVEDGEGNGPFTSRNGFCPPSLEAGALPMPSDEGLSPGRFNYTEPRFGFHADETQQCWHYWFTTSDRETLRPYGYKLSHYVVLIESVRVGDTQLVFDRAHATLIMENPL
jgi:hypothetical protein